MEILGRGLEKNFVEALAAAYSGSAWWKSIVEDPELFIAPRKTCVCVYYRGNRLLKLELSGGKLAGKVHYKYLLNPRLKPEYCRVIDGQAESPKGAGGISAFIPDFSDLDLLKRASKPYAGEEKYGVSEIIFANPNIIDVEVAFRDSGDSSEDDDPPPEETVLSKSHHNLRIDFVAVQKDGAGFKLAFFEAKHFANQELRSSGTPLVLKQIATYEKLLNNNQDDIVKAYKLHCADMLKSNCVPQDSKRRRFLTMVSEQKSIIVNTEPRLVVFGFDDDQKPGPAWTPHQKKLEDCLGKDRVILRGNAKGLVRGVRFQEP
ncbi:MAG: hypothetical protein Q7S58_05500 [Candidatus Binatus sp.]|uniref:hypothetical protein n=1 Tax=Candidatus Binatus sp. TaxID=2811406 RepID=UPI0027283A9E|nr:hypothetical protein [Candidatus Binatus sp.]MDO8431850.1 hypothetical protein [Candidatus Binatus sp.]